MVIGYYEKNGKEIWLDQIMYNQRPFIIYRLHKEGTCRKTLLYCKSFIDSDAHVIIDGTKIFLTEFTKLN